MPSLSTDNMKRTNIKKDDIIKLKSVDHITLENDCIFESDGIRIGKCYINESMYHMFGHEHSVNLTNNSVYGITLFDDKHGRYWNFALDWVEDPINIIINVDDLFKDIDI